MLESINNFVQINENIATSGQPTQEQFEAVAKAGYEVVINLAVCHSEGRLDNEDQIITDLGMTYIHIPVDFEEPTEQNAIDFVELLTALQNKKVWVHCIFNYRVSAFMYLFHKYVLRTPFDDINLEIFEQWQPSVTWQNIMKIELQ